MDKEKIESSFYEKEIQQVVKTDDVFKIKKVLSTGKRKGAKEYLSSGRAIRKNLIRRLANPT